MSKPEPSSLTSKERVSPPRRHSNRDCGGVARVLRGVLQRLEAAEVDRRLDIRRIPPQPVRVDAGRDRRTERCRRECICEPSVLEERRVDAVREVAKLLQRRLDFVVQPAEQFLGFPGSESARSRASLSWTASPMRCCCAPSWRSRSIRRRSASAASTTRVREARSSLTCSSLAPRASGSNRRARLPATRVARIAARARRSSCSRWCERTQLVAVGYVEVCGEVAGGDSSRRSSVSSIGATTERARTYPSRRASRALAAPTAMTRSPGARIRSAVLIDERDRIRSRSSRELVGEEDERVGERLCPAMLAGAPSRTPPLRRTR